MKYFKILIFFQLILFIYSCSTIKEGFTNQKKSSSDEFLVEKKSPLVMPPDYNNLPVPGQKKETLKIDQNKIKDLVIKNENETGEMNNSAKDNSNIEKSILKYINNYCILQVLFFLIFNKIINNKK